MIHGYYIAVGKGGAFLLHIHFEFVLRQVHRSAPASECTFRTLGWNNITNAQTFVERVRLNKAEELPLLPPRAASFPENLLLVGSGESWRSSWRTWMCVAELLGYDSGLCPQMLSLSLFTRGSPGKSLFLRPTWEVALLKVCDSELLAVSFSRAQFPLRCLH